MSFDVDMDYIAEHLNMCGEPYVVSLDDDTHVFHFGTDREHWNCTSAGVMFVNKMGHFFRLLWQGDLNKWVYANKWISIADVEAYDRAPALDDSDPMTVISRASIGGKSGDGLSYLPKEVFGPGVRRALIWRDRYIRLTYPNRQNFDEWIMSCGTIRSGVMKGKPWDHAGALMWCKQNLADAPLNYVGTSIQAVKKAAAFEASVTSHPLYGSF